MKIRVVLFSALVILLWISLGTAFEWVSIFVGMGILGAVLVWFREDLTPILVVKDKNSWARVFGAPLAILRYVWVLIISNLEVIWLIIKFRYRVQPAILRIHTGKMGDLEQTILANSITLTPGTITMEFSEDREYMYIHVLDVQDIEIAKEQLRKHIKVHFGEGLKWWTSPLM
jgi:multicomponent Na+:H+ antiporter subunit E